MPGNISEYGADKALDYLVEGKWLALYKDATTEVSGGGYSRLKLEGKMAAASEGAKANSTELLFPVATATWGTIAHFRIVDAASGAANSYLEGELDVVKTIEVNDEWAAAPGELAFSMG
jgi:hypothetical protein